MQVARGSILPFVAVALVVAVAVAVLAVVAVVAVVAAVVIDDNWRSNDTVRSARALQTFPSKGGAGKSMLSALVPCLVLHARVVN